MGSISRFSQGEEIAVSLVYQVKRATTKQPTENVGLFSKNVGDFLNYLRRFFVFCALFVLVLRVASSRFMGCFILIYAQLSFDVCVVDASSFVVDCSSSRWYFVNNILVFRGG